MSVSSFLAAVASAALSFAVRSAAFFSAAARSFFFAARSSLRGVQVFLGRIQVLLGCFRLLLGIGEVFCRRIQVLFKGVGVRLGLGELVGEVLVLRQQVVHGLRRVLALGRVQVAGGVQLLLQLPVRLQLLATAKEDLLGRVAVGVLGLAQHREAALDVDVGGLIERP